MTGLGYGSFLGAHIITVAHGTNHKNHLANMHNLERNNKEVNMETVLTLVQT